jgi:hypothetical protein
MEACHENGDETDNRLENLRWDTHSANLLDKRRHGTMWCGEKHHKAKLKETDIPVIRQRRESGESLRSIAADYNITQTMTSLIARRKAWQHVA